MPGKNCLGRAFLFVSIALLASLSSGVNAQERYVAGKDYQIIQNPVRTSNPDKIEVMEVFWYGCPHCNDFRPRFDDWKKQQAADVNVQHQPAIWNARMVKHAYIFYTAKTLGKLDVMHKEIFDAMHVKRQKLQKDSEIYPLFAKHGISEEQYNKTVKSFGVKSQTKQAEARARGYGIRGTPEVIVNGKYRVSANMVGSQANMLKVADFLIQKERAGKS